MLPIWLIHSVLTLWAGAGESEVWWRSRGLFGGLAGANEIQLNFSV